MAINIHLKEKTKSTVHYNDAKELRKKKTVFLHERIKIIIKLITRTIMIKIIIANYIKFETCNYVN